MVTTTAKTKKKAPKKAPKKDTMRSRRQRSVVESNGRMAKNRVAEHTPEGDARVEIRTIQRRQLLIPIEGTSPLIVNSFSKPKLDQIRDKQQKKARGPRLKRDPEAEYLASLYVMPGTGKPGEKDTKYGVPAVAFKKAAIDGCRLIEGMHMTVGRLVFHVLEDAGGLVQITHAKKSPHLREDPVRLQGKGKPLDLRYRGEFTKWRCVLRVEYSEGTISPEELINMINVAGFHVGIGEMRPEKGPFQNGRFQVVAK